MYRPKTLTRTTLIAKPKHHTKKTPLVIPVVGNCDTQTANPVHSSVLEISTHNAAPHEPCLSVPLLETPHALHFSTII